MLINVSQSVDNKYDLKMAETKDAFVPDENIDHEKKEEKKKKKRKQRQHSHHRHHHHHHRKSYVPNFNQPGVVHIPMNDAVQRYLNCVVGEGVTAEKPWKKISKDLVLEQIDNDEVTEDFLPFVAYKAEILQLPGDELLVGYIPNETGDYDEFYLCVLESAEASVIDTIKEIEEKQQARLNNSINKKVHTWKSFGSEAEVEENIPRSSRGFLKVELETKYPIMTPNLTFQYRFVDQAKDGYCELKVPPRYAVPNINKKRIHSSAQVAPSTRSIYAQTNYPFPKNIWTQYEYECTYEEITKENKDKFINFFNEIMDPLCDRLFINYHVNLFSNDYKDLISYTHSAKQMNDAVERLSFKDIKRCKDKMISAIAWHPMWTGIVAIAYANISPLWVNSVKAPTDFLTESVHGQNPVLIWSFDDTLAPKLLLETTCEVHCLAFCPQDENLLIGGCSNGQVLLWDIRNKLTKVEEVEILTTAQHKYRTLMFSMMKWMMNTKNLSIVQATAISGLTYSHLSNVTSISWIHPLYEVSKTGQFQEIDEMRGETASLQFITSSSDGTIKFWDLKQKPIILPGDYRPQKKSKRFKTRPPALTTDVSPFRALNRKLLPHYQINLILPKLELTSPLTSVAVPTLPIEYERVSEPKEVENELTDRILYKPILVRNEEDDILKCQFVVGTYLGEFAAGTWDGYEYSTGELVCTELPKMFSIARYHDGPVLTMARHHTLSNLYLSVGGKVFAVWSETLANRPVFWRRSKHKYTYGDWRKTNPCCFGLGRSDGNWELWNLQFKGNAPYFVAQYSGKAVFEGTTQPFKVADNMIMGIADWQGSFRISAIIEDPVDLNKNLKKLKSIIESSAQRRKSFETWQNSWVEKHASWILEQMEEARREAQRLREEAAAAKQYEEEMKAQEAEEAAKRATYKSKAPPGHYEEWAHEQYICREQDRMGNVLLSNKRLDRETLLKQQMPLKKREAEVERKRQRQRSRLQKADIIFQDTIRMLFPDLAEIKAPSTKVGISVPERETLKEQYFYGYNETKIELDEKIENNPYVYKFNWKDVLIASKQKRKLIEFGHQFSHKIRYEAEKQEMLAAIHAMRQSFSIKKSIEIKTSGEEISDEVTM